MFDLSSHCHQNLNLLFQNHLNKNKRIKLIDDFALRAMTAKESDYIPEGDETYAYTKMLGGGESDRITFDSPKPGTYTFLCTFPGHYQVMRGEFIVE